MHRAPVGPDEQQNEGVVSSLSYAAVGAHAGGRRSEMVVDPLRDEAALIGLAHAQRADELRLETAEHRQEVGRRVGFVFEDKVIAVD